MAIFLMVLALSGFAEGKTLVLGGAAGWPAFSREHGLSRAPGRLGHEAVVLDSSVQAMADDLHVSFDQAGFADETGRYTVISNELRAAAAVQARHGGAALCNTDDSGLTLQGKPGSLFGSAGSTGSFTLSFWLYPAVTENGSILFQWRSSLTGSGRPRYQFIRSIIMKNRIEWSFSNIWRTFADESLDIVLSGRRTLVPGEWTHHELSYDAGTGLLEYRMDGMTEDLRFMTAGNSESGDVYPAVLGAVSEVEIAPRYSGLLDEFRITREAATPVTLDRRNTLLARYPAAGGRFVTNPVDSGTAASILDSLNADLSEPPETGTSFFVRAGDNFYQWTDTSPAWVPVRPGERISGVSGRYFQVAAELYTDGTASATPVLSSISLQYRNNEPPWPPVRIMAKPGDRSVTLSWAASVDHDTQGYIVYYGNRPGEYLAEGSPLDAGNTRSVTIGNLENGVVYYFSVSAYDAAGRDHQGPLSAEVHARPLAVHGSGGNGNH